MSPLDFGLSSFVAKWIIIERVNVKSLSQFWHSDEFDFEYTDGKFLSDVSLEIPMKWPII